MRRSQRESDPIRCHWSRYRRLVSHCSGKVKGTFLATYVLIHGAGDSCWSWHLVAAELRSRGHEVIAPDLPCDDETAGLTDYADTVVAAIGDQKILSWWGYRSAATRRHWYAHARRPICWSS
ncbi:MAG: alpha/beta fold hydrolase [Thermomicrobiales bacterium]